MAKKIIMAMILMMFFSGGIFAQVATPEAGQYVTRAELVKQISELTGEKEEKILELMFSQGLSKEATMADLIEILFQSGLLKKQVNAEKKIMGKPILKAYK